MHRFLGKVVIEILLVLKLEDKAMGKSFAKRFPGAVLACHSLLAKIWLP